MCVWRDYTSSPYTGMTLSLRLASSSESFIALQKSRYERWLLPSLCLTKLWRSPDYYFIMKIWFCRNCAYRCNSCSFSSY